MKWHSMTYCTIKNSCVGVCFCTFMADTLYLYSFIYNHPILTAETVTKNLMNERKRHWILWNRNKNKIQYNKIQLHKIFNRHFISISHLKKSSAFCHIISCTNVAPLKLHQLCNKSYWRFMVGNLNQCESLYIHLCLMLKFYTFVNKDIEPN
jgi:hypothetical protein